MKDTEFIDGEIEGVVLRSPTVNKDDRGWLLELFRTDETRIRHEMAYISGTMPQVVRGPHMHKQQTDYFCFLGIGKFDLYLWDNNPRSKTYWNRQVFRCYTQTIVTVPPLVVHAYKNVSEEDIGLVINIPDRLYAGVNKSERVDEVRFEKISDSPFKIW